MTKFTKPNGRFVGEYSAFVPKKLPPSFSMDRESLALLARAERKMGELKGRGRELENPHILLRTYLKREAVLSSRIEGTLASLEDLNKHEAFGGVSVKDARNLRLAEVINYVRALEESLQKIRRSGVIDAETLKQAHKTLMSGVRGGDKNPGKLRRQQNWIAGRALVYTPPPPENVEELLSNLVDFVKSDDEISPLIQCAVAHYQFEAIHPFLDGNGRIGRLLVLLLLHNKDMLLEPALYLSAFFDRHRKEYYAGLLQVSQKSRWRAWIRFFLHAFESQACESIECVDKLVRLRKKYRGRVYKQPRAAMLADALFSNPYTSVPRAQKTLKATYPSAKRAVYSLVDAGILKEMGKHGGRMTFVAQEIEDALR